MAIYLAKNESMPNIAAGLDEMYSRFASRLQEAVGYAANSHHSLRRVADRYFGRWDTNDGTCFDTVTLPFFTGYMEIKRRVKDKANNDYWFEVLFTGIKWDEASVKGVKIPGLETFLDSYLRFISWRERVEDWKDYKLAGIQAKMAFSIPMKKSRKIKRAFTSSLGKRSSPQYPSILQS